MSTSTHAGRTKAPILGKVGLRIGKCKLLDVIGVGGFGEVWKAQEEIEGQPVGPPCAIKIMRLGKQGTGSSGNETLKSGWVQEINALKSIRHDAIPRTFDGGIDESTGFAYIAMELLDGETLAQRISEKRMGWRRALMIAEHIANALDTAHAQGVIHRDLKPQNVFIEHDGRVRVIDWGIAKLGTGPEVATGLPAKRDPNESSDTGTQDISMEEQRNIALHNRPLVPRVVGTQGYIAPEIYEGAEPSAEVDAYALGVVLYQCITGRLPHRIEMTSTGSGASAQDVLRAYSIDVWKATTEGQLTDLAEVIADIPEGVRALVEGLLSRTPSERGAGTLVSRIVQVNRFPFGLPDPPYVGLNAFGTDRAGFLFGRDAHVDRIVKRLERDQAIVLSGPSGCGKSSLAIAGVAARIDRIMLDGMDGWRALVVRPSETRALQKASSEEGKAKEALAAPFGTVVVVDQLEEVLGLEATRRETFCQALATLAKRTDAVMVQGQRIARDAPMRLIATVRDDFEWQVVRIESLRDLCETSRCLVTGVDATSARELVEEPAKAVGYQFEPGNEVVHEVEKLLAADPTALPIVQFAMSEWWSRRDEKKKELPARAWREFGGVEGVLSHVADRYYRRLAEADQQVLRELFGRLLLGDRKQWVREDSLANDVERRLMDQLVELRLVRRRDDGEGRVGYEWAHESLARRWDVLKQWISERAAEDAFLADLEQEAKLWARQGRPTDRLRPKLVLTENVRKRLHADALAYADASLDAGLYAERMARAAWRRKWGSVVMSFVVLVVIILLLLDQQTKLGRALADVKTQLNRAKEAEEAAGKAEKAEKEARKLAEEKQALAKENAEEAQRLRKEKDEDYNVLDARIRKAKSLKELEEIQRDLNKKRRESKSEIETPPPPPPPASTGVNPVARPPVVEMP